MATTTAFLRVSSPGTPRWMTSLKDGARRVAELAATPLVPADYLDIIDPLRRGADLRGRIESIHAETADAATIVIRPGADWAGHVPGQYVRIGIDVDGVRQWRAYSLTHGPRADGRISVTVKAVPEGKVSNHLVHDARVGTLVHLEQAAGEFVLPPEGGKFLFVTAGSGITPVIGMLRNLFPVADSGAVQLPRSAAYDITVVHVAPTEPDSIFLRQPARARPRRPDHAGRAVRRRARRPRRRRARRAGARPRRPRHARLRPRRPARRADHPPRRPRPGAAHRAVPRRHAGDRRGRHRQLRPQRHHLRGQRRPPILDQAEDAGVLMPSGCRMGVCFGCVLPLREGVVRDLRSGDITTAVEGDGVNIQTCISAAAGPCRIDH